MIHALSRRRSRPLSLMRDFLARESAGGIVLMVVAALAILVANSPLAQAYSALRETDIGPLSMLHWVNDALMALFFLLVGLEIKRELLDGQLSTWERRRLPGLAAAAGMAVPALIYVAFNEGDPTALRGWAIPAATDIAFALGVLALLGPRVPASLKLFLAALAILDDLGAVAIIAIFYTAELDLAAFAAALAGVAALGVASRFGLRRLWPFLVAAPAIWWATYLSGVHATLAGVALAAVIPLRPAPGRPDDPASPLHRLEHALQRPIAFVVVPLFGFFNAGVALGGVSAGLLMTGVPLGIALGLFAGKQVGVLGAVWLAVRLRVADLPADATWRQTYGVACLCGIGFTMSLFVGDLAFPGDPARSDLVKVGVLMGSVASALLGALVLARAPRATAAGVPASSASARPAPPAEDAALLGQR